MALLSNPTATQRVTGTKVAWLRVTPYLGGPTIKARRTLARDGVTQDPDKQTATIPRCLLDACARFLFISQVLGAAPPYPAPIYSY